jgi:hypothetical protein
MVDFGAGFGFFGDAVGDLFAMNGANIAAAGYKTAAKYEETSAQLERANTKIKMSAAERAIEGALGGQKSDITGQGFQFSGTAIDLAADSAHEGAITKALIETQGSIAVNAHESAKQQYLSQAAQAKNAAAGAGVSGLLSIVGGVFSLFSDERLKENIVRIARDVDGKNIYEFNYTGLPKKKFRGYIAQELDPSQVTNAVGFLVPDEAHRSVEV